MGRIMRGYTDQEIAAIASFFAEQPWTSTDRTASAALAHRGHEIHEVQCETCHGDGGRTQEDESRICSPDLKGSPQRPAGPPAPRPGACTAMDGARPTPTRSAGTGKRL